MYKKVKLRVTRVTIFWKTHKVKCKPYQPNSDPKYFKGHYFSNQTKCKPKPSRRSFDLYEANQMETKRKKLWKNMEKILPTIYRKWNQNETNFLQTLLLKPEWKNSDGKNLFDRCKKLTLVRFAFGFVEKWSVDTFK